MVGWFLFSLSDWNWNQLATACGEKKKKKTFYLPPPKRIPHFFFSVKTTFSWSVGRVNKCRVDVFQLLKLKILYKYILIEFHDINIKIEQCF